MKHSRSTVVSEILILENIVYAEKCKQMISLIVYQITTRKILQYYFMIINDNLFVIAS